MFGGYTSIASTELLLHGDSTWTQVGSLPHSLFGLKAVSLNNEVIATGDVYQLQFQYVVVIVPISKGGTHRNDLIDLGINQKTVLKFDPITFQWSEVGTMKKKRSNHAISAVNAEDVAEYCN